MIIGDGWTNHALPWWFISAEQMEYAYKNAWVKIEEVIMEEAFETF